MFEKAHDHLYDLSLLCTLNVYSSFGFVDKATQPALNIIGVLRVGEQGQVSCSVHYTCLSAPPSLTIDGISGVDKTMDTLVSDGIWERKVERNWTVREEDHSAKCTVVHLGGQKATSEVRLNVECE